MRNFSKSVRLQLLVGLSIMISVSPLSLSRSLDPEIENKLNTFIKDFYLPTSQVNGLGLSIIQNDGEVLYTNGYGISNVENQTPVTNETQFIIGSVSKSFAAVALIKTLNEKFPELGESVLDTPFKKLVPDMNLTFIDRFRTEHGTIRDLLAHRMCFPPTQSDWPYMAEAIDTRDDMIYRQRYVEEVCGIRTSLRYSNPMITVAGEIFAHLKNKRYEEAIGDFLQEIGMTNTAMFTDISNFPKLAAPYYVKDGEAHPVNVDLLKRVLVANPAGGVVTCPNDMIKYIQLHLNLGKVDGKQVIPEEVMKWMSKPATYAQGFELPPNKYSLAINAYGLGLMLGTFRGAEYVMHPGYFTPYSSQISLYPDKNLGIFSTTNYGPMVLPQLILHAYIYDLLNEAPNATASAVEFAETMKIHQDEQNAKRQRSLELFLEKSKSLGGGRQTRAEEVVGKYGTGSGGEAEIIEQWNSETNETQLFVKYGRWAHGWLDHVEGATYKVRLVTDLVQDDYAIGMPDSGLYVSLYDEILEFSGANVVGSGAVSYGKFKLGLTLDKLPPIPWLPGSCGPE